MRQRQVAARGQFREQPGRQAPGIVAIGDEVHDRYQQQRDQQAQVQGLPQVRGAKDGADIAQVGINAGGLAPPGRRSAAPARREHDGIVVHVRDQGPRVRVLRDLVHIGGGGNTGANVQELGNARVAGQITYRAAQEGPVLPRRDP